MDSSDEDSPEIETLDFSNDTHYQIVPSTKIRDAVHEDYREVPIYGSPTIRHSLPAYDLWRPFFPTHLSAEKFRTFHRPALRHFKRGPQVTRRGKTKALAIKNLSRQIYRSQKDLRNKIVRAINSGMSRDAIVSKLLSIRKAKDLTAKRGELFLFEYSEENPPVLSQIGMASNIKTYVNPDTHGPISQGAKRQVLTKSDRDNITSSHELNTASQKLPTSDKNISSLTIDCTIGVREILSHMRQPKPIYFSPLRPGTETMFIENNLYRAPIFPHDVDDCDFLVIRTRNNIYVRSFHKIFAVGQTMPLDIIPPPTVTAITKFRAELSNLYIHKQFKDTDSSHPVINLNSLAKLFPDYHISSLRRRLSCQGAKHLGDGQYHRGTSKYGLGTLRDDRSILKPEQYCFNMSMLANRQRLRDLNYLESMIFPSDTVELETEVLAAPWNTSKAINDTVLGRCYLDLKQHKIDPTGPQREGFSCVSWIKSPTEEEQKSQQNNRPIQAPAQPSSIPTTNPMAFKIKREKLERLAIFHKEAQLISKVQSEVLASHEVLSSDEGSDPEADEEDNLNSSFDQQVKDLDRLVVDGRTSDQLNFEREEEERRTLMSMFVNNSNDKAAGESSNQTKASDGVSQYRNKVLKIFRSYATAEGVVEVKTELVREPQIIARYVQLKSSSELDPKEKVDTAKNNLPTPETTASPLPNMDSPNPSHRRRSLGPSELCRADGMTLVISKSVLTQSRPLRRCSRDSNNSSFYR